jgi:hypothetical protein
MKFTFFTLLFITYFFGFAQDTLVAKKSNLGLIASTEMNVVYRGVRNPISIAVPHAKSFTVSGPGVSQENGSYYITPGQGNEMVVTLEIVLEDDSKVVEEHVFRIKTVPYPQGRINNRNCNDCYVNMNVEALKNAVISVHFEDFQYDYTFEVISFVIVKPKKPGIIVEGNTINENAFNQLKKLKEGDIITIGAIKYKVNPNVSAMWPSVGLIQVRISD